MRYESVSKQGQEVNLRSVTQETGLSVSAKVVCERVASQRRSSPDGVRTIESDRRKSVPCRKEAFALDFGQRNIVAQNGSDLGSP